MNSLDLGAYGVSEMTKREMQETNGGSILGLIAVGLIGALVGFVVTYVLLDQRDINSSR